MGLFALPFGLQQHKPQQTTHDNQAEYNGNNHHCIHLPEVSRSRAVGGNVQRGKRALPCVRFLDTVHTPKSSIGQTKKQRFQISGGLA